MTRAEFSKKTKLDAFLLVNGQCRSCGIKLTAGNCEFHHDRECTFAGTNELKNCIPLCKNCHRAITNKQARVIAKSNRVRSRHLGVKRRISRPMPGTRASGIRKRFNGAVERW